MDKKELSFQYQTSISGILRFILFIFLGIVLFFGVSLIGIGLLSLGAEGDLIYGLKFLLLGTTIFLFVIFGFFYNRLSSRTKVVHSYFDTVNKRYYLETKSGESGYIPFSEIDSFAMRKEIISGSKSSTTYYVVYFLKKDGAWWDITSYGNEISALKKLNELQEKVKFGEDDHFNLLEKESASKLFSFAEKEDGVIFKWGVKVSFLYHVVGILAIISFISSFGIIASLTNEVGSIGYYIIIGFSSIFGALVFYAIFQLIFGYKNHELEITKERITFIGVKKNKRKILSEIPTSEIKFTQYSFNIHRSDIFNGQEIYLLNQEFADKLNKYKKGEFGISEIFSLMKEIMQLKKSIIKLPFPGFKSIDIILFEKKLDEELRKVNPEVK